MIECWGFAFGNFPFPRGGDLLMTDLANTTISQVNLFGCDIFVRSPMKICLALPMFLSPFLWMRLFVFAAGRSYTVYSLRVPRTGTRFTSTHVSIPACTVVMKVSHLFPSLTYLALLCRNLCFRFSSLYSTTFPRTEFPFSSIIEDIGEFNPAILTRKDRFDLYFSYALTFH